MQRRKFIQMVSAGSALLSGAGVPLLATASANRKRARFEITADVVVAGGGLGGFAATLAMLKSGLKVVLTEETDWIGGQITQQGVPPDEHQWIETHGAPQSYRDFRTAVRDYYRRHYPLKDEARANAYLNPGNGSVSRLCHEPRIALFIMESLLAPYVSSGQLTLLLRCRISGADMQGDRIRALTGNSPHFQEEVVLNARFFVDATELGDLLPLSRTEYVTGTESRNETGELHAPLAGNPQNNQAFTMCLAMDYEPDADHTIPKPRMYDHWRNYIPKLSPPWPGLLLDLHYANPKTLQPKKLGFNPNGTDTGSLLNLWNYRRIIDHRQFGDGFYQGGISIMNWPQNDYMEGNLIDVSDEAFQHHVDRAKQLSLSMFYWLQTEAPTPEGKPGWKGLRLRGDVLGTHDGLAKYPYIRESRRIKAKFTVLEEHVGAEQRKMVTGKDEKLAADFFDSVGIGYYHIDLHPSNLGNNYIDFSSLPFQIPLGALLPERVENLLPANKNIGTTHITNGCYRLHPVEWSIGEVVGLLIVFSDAKRTIPTHVWENRQMLAEFQTFIRKHGIDTHWPS